MAVQCLDREDFHRKSCVTDLNAAFSQKFASQFLFLLSNRPVVDVKTVVQILLEVGLLLAGTIIFQCVIVAINNVTKVCFVLCVGEHTDSSLMLPWCSVSLVRSGSMQAVITLIRKNIKSIMPRSFHTSVQTASQRRDPYSCW